MQLGATSGQGDATLDVTVTSNDGGAVRSAAVVVNNQRATISQEARPCTYELRASPQSFGSQGGLGGISVTTLTGCSWTVSTSAEWLRLSTTTGSGPGTVPFEVVGNGGSQRMAAVTIGGQTVGINQSAVGQSGDDNPNCAATLSPSTINAAFGGGTHSATLTIDSACGWMAGSGASWVSIAPTSGRGNATLTITVAANTGGARSASLTVAESAIAVNQAAEPACSFTIDPGTASFGTSGGDGRIRVTTQDWCDWTASGGASWAQITNGRGSGNGEVRYTVAANSSTSSRSATISVGGRSHTINQQAAAPTCTYTIDPGSSSFSAAGGTGSVTVTTQQGCQWSTSGGANWITVAANQGSGTGSGQFSYTVQANSGGARSAGISVGGHTHTVSQEAAPAQTCTFQLQPTSQNFVAGGGNAQFSVTTQGGCTWNASSSAGWISTSSSGSGSGTVSFSVAANTGAARQGSITVGGQSFNVTQDAGQSTCTFQLQPTSQNFVASGGSGQFSVTTQTGCSWNASGGAGWVSTSSSGSGSGTVTFSVQANSGSARQTTISVGGQSFNVTQDAAQTCTFQLQPTSQNFVAGGGSGQFSVTTQNGCTWSASSGAGWVSTSSSGSGSGTVSFSVQANSGSARQTSISVGGQSFSVTQDAAQTCTFQLQPTSQNFVAGGGSGQFNVTTQSGCTWSASSGAGWVSTSSSGSGSGTVSFSVQANGSNARQTTISVGGQSFSVTQDAAAPPPPPACTYTLQPTSQNFVAAGGTGQFTVTTQGTCAWSASSGAGWVTTSSSGTGSGTVSFSVQGNAGAMRQTSISVGGQSFSVTQDAAPSGGGGQ